MPVELPYLSSNKNVETLFQRIRSAKVPEAVTTRYLSETLGLGSSNDRALITLLKTLGFLDAAGTPTKEYNYLKDEKAGAIAIGQAIRHAYEALFASNEKAYELTPEDLKGLVAQVAGTDDKMTSRIVSTFKALSAVANFDSAQANGADSQGEDGTPAETSSDEEVEVATKPLRPDFHYNIQIHLPANGSEETYLNIFNAVRKVFK